MMFFLTLGNLFFFLAIIIVISANVQSSQYFHVYNCIHGLLDAYVVCMKRYSLWNCFITIYIC